MCETRRNLNPKGVFNAAHPCLGRGIRTKADEGAVGDSLCRAPVKKASPKAPSTFRHGEQDEEGFVDRCAGIRVQRDDACADQWQYQQLTQFHNGSEPDPVDLFDAVDLAVDFFEQQHGYVVAEPLELDQLAVAQHVLSVVDRHLEPGSDPEQQLEPFADAQHLG